MNTTYRVNANDLDAGFVESLKALFRDKEIEINVSEVDETLYLLQSEPNKRRLLEAIQNVESGQNLVEVSLDALE